MAGVDQRCPVVHLLAALDIFSIISGLGVDMKDGRLMQPAIFLGRSVWVVIPSWRVVGQGLVMNQLLFGACSTSGLIPVTQMQLGPPITRSCSLYSLFS